MANDPKKQQPNDDSPDTGSGEELPPWLRGGATPPPPADSAPPAPTAGAIPRLAPRKSAGDAPADDPSVPPWLRGLQPPEEKKVIIGGKEVSMEFFNEADSLANDSNTDMTYDAWLADQVESRREKSVEEELPDFFDAIAGQVSAEAETKKTESAYPIRDVTGGTSQLPDWFLGLEELDDTDAPDWVRQIGADATNNPAPQPPQPPDPVVDFFQDMGLPIDDDSYSDLELPSSSFFTELVGKPSAPQVSAEPPPTDDDVPDFGMLSTARAASSAPPSSSFGKTIRLDDADSFSPSAPPPQGGQTIRLQDPFGDFDADDAPPATVDGRAAEAPYGESTAASDRQSALDDDDPFAGFDLFETPDDPISTEPTLASVPEAVEISQYELDAFLDGIDPPAPMPSPDVSDIDDPDMDLFIGRPAPIAPPEAAARETPRDLADDSMNWLSEIEGIVSSATRANTRALDPNILNLASSPDARVPRSFDDLPAYTEPTPVPTPTADDDSAFSWDDWEAQPAATIDPPAAPEPENANDLDWLTGIQEEDAPHEAKTVQVDREVLARMGLLNRQTNVEVTPPDDDRETIFALPDGFNDSSATLPTPLFDAPPASSKPDSAPLQLSSLYSADIDPEAEEWDPFAEAGLEVIDLDAFDPDSPKFDSGVYPRDFDAATLERLNSLSGVAPDESAIFDAELRSGWLQDDLLDEAVLLDSVRGLDPLTPMVSPVITDDEEDALDFLRETPRALETSVDDSDDAFFALIDRASDGTAPVSTFERPDDENTIGQASTIDFGLFDSLSTELPSYTPTSAYSFADDDDEADTLDLSMFDAPSDTSGESGTAPYTPTSAYSFADDDDEADTLDLSMFDAPEPSTASNSARTAMLPQTGFLFDDDDEDKPDTLDLSMFDAPSDTTGESAPVYTSPSAYRFADDDEDQPDTLDLSMFDLPSDTTGESAPAAYTPPSAFSFDFEDEDNQPDTLDLSMFDLPSDTTGESAPAAYTPQSAYKLDFDTQEDHPDTLIFSQLDSIHLDEVEGAVSRAEPPADDPHATQMVIDKGGYDDWQPRIPTADTAHVENAASENFVDNFNLDDLRTAPRTISDDMFEVEDILAALDSDNAITEEDTQPQEAIIIDAAPSAPLDDLFAGWDALTEQAPMTSTDLDDLDSIFGVSAGQGDQDEEQSAPDFFATSWDDAPASAEPVTRWQTETPFAQPDFDDSNDAPIPGFGEGLDWASVFDADAADRASLSGQESAQIDAFLGDSDDGIDIFTRDTELVPPFAAEPPRAPAQMPVFDDLDSYLESIDIEQPQMGQNTGILFDRPNRLDIDALLDQMVTPGESRRPSQSPFSDPGVMGLESADIDFLRDMGASVDDVSAGALVRQKQDRPVEELPARLRKLRERSRQSEAASSAPAELDSLTDILPGVDIALSPANFTTGASTLEQALAIPSEQQARVNLLTRLVGAAPIAPSRMSAIEMTYDSPFMQDLESDEENIVHALPVVEPAVIPARQARQRRIRVQPDRLLIVIALAAALIAPIVVPALRLGDPPPALFDAESPAAASFSALDALDRGDLVLVGMEYTPGAAGELDPMTEALLRHIVLRGAVPIVVGANPLTLLRAERQFESINADAALLTRIDARQPLERGYDYSVARFLTGGAIGLRAFSADSAALLASDVTGQTGEIGVAGLNSFALLVLITDSGETVRDYAEQIAPYSGAPLVVAASYGAAPLAEPYARAGGVDALLVGYGDALTYAGLLDGVDPVPRGVRLVRTPAPVVPSMVDPVLPDTLGTDGATPGAVIEVTPESTPAMTPTPSEAAALTAIIIADDRVNLRNAPNRTATILTALDPGTRVTLLGSGGDNDSWANVALADGRIGWVLASLLTIESPTRKTHPDRAPHRQEFDVEGEATNTRRPPVTRRAATPTESATDEPIPTATPSATFTRTLALSRTPTPTTTESSPAPTDSDAAPDAATVTPTETTAPTTTAEPTATTEPTPTIDLTPSATPTDSPPLPTPTPLVFSDGLRQERWYSVNMGIVVSVLIIGGGALANIARSLLRRRK